MINTRIILLVCLFILGSCQTGSNNKKEENHSGREIEVKRVNIAEIEVGIKSYIDRKVNNIFLSF